MKAREDLPVAGNSCSHPELYYGTRVGDSVEWICPTCGYLINLGPVHCDHVRLTLRPPKYGETSYRCIVGDCPSVYFRPPAL